MSGQELFFLVFTVLGGLALFILGMNIMTDGLHSAAGSSLRSILAKATGNRWIGIALGTVLGVLIHSSATTVMLVGFVNAGLVSLVEAVPPILGANIGTTLSMQVISFKLDEYCYVAIVVGFLLQMAAPKDQVKQIGRAIVGFGLLFLGMRTMSGAIKPHREFLAPFLGQIDGSTLPGLLLGVLMSTAITGIIQSSGATVGMCYALINAGVFTRLEQVYPIVLGAHIGTCATALLGSIGTTIEARRAAVSHLLFNVMNVTMAVVAAPFFLWLVPLTAADLVHQTANLHTIVITAAAVILLPFAAVHARLVELLVRSREPPPEPSFLDRGLADRPEKAIYAGIRELQRVTRVCSGSLRGAVALLGELDGKTIRGVRLNEEAVDEIKLAMKDFLAVMTSRHLSKRQAVLIQHIERCMVDLERIHDHIDSICDLSVARSRTPQAAFRKKQVEWLAALYHNAASVLRALTDSLDPDNQHFHEVAEAVLAASGDYMEMSSAVKQQHLDKMAAKEIPPIAGVFFSEYHTAFDRIVQHARNIALVEQEPQFWIKQKKLKRMVEEATIYVVPESDDFNQLLDELGGDEEEETKSGWLK